MNTHTHKTSTALHALFICALLTMFVMRNTAHAQNAAVKPRIVITCDPELDDNNSLIRFLLYSSDVLL
jgi:hypothetical protein